MDQVSLKVTGRLEEPCCAAPRLDAQGWLKGDGMLFIDLACLECGRMLAMFSWDRSDQKEK